MQERIVNFTFHGVGEPCRPLEAGEEQVWLGVDRFESLLDSAVARNDLRIMFDDGNASDLRHALPALCRRGLRATFFVVAGRLGAPGFLDRDGVCELAAAGMAIGSHGMHHRQWRRLDETALREELVDARRILESVLGAPVKEAACPFGAYDRRTLRALRRHGYRRAYTSDRGTTQPDDWLQARNTVRRDDPDGLVEELVTNGGPLRALRRRAKITRTRWG